MESLVVVDMMLCVLLGPLLYHFADMPNEPSIELGYAELKKLILSLNFEIVVSFSFADQTRTLSTLSSVLRHCWLGARKSILSVNIE